jgi:small subunit ribosomal protein S17
MADVAEKKEEKRKKRIVGTSLSTRGRTFQGVVSKKFDTRVVVEFERTVRVAKYERFAKRRTKIHARIPEGMQVEEGDLVKVRECRPLSKIIHFQVVEVLRRNE